MLQLKKEKKKNIYIDIYTYVAIDEKNCLTKMSFSDMVFIENVYMIQPNSPKVTS